MSLPFQLAASVVEAEKRGSGASEIVDQVDEPEPCTRILQVLAKIIEQISPLVRVDLRALYELLVAEQTRIHMADRVGVRPVAQSHEQSLAAQALARYPGIRVDEHAVRLDVALGRRHAEDDDLERSAGRTARQVAASRQDRCRLASERTKA